MNPELPAPQINREQAPQQHEGGEVLPSHEAAGGQSYEKEQNIQRGDRQSAPPPVAVPVPLPVVPLPTVPAPAATDDTSGPTIASDDDLIEKEWVDKAKKIIAETQNDPYRREQEISKLQVDYLRKRYGKELGISN